ncbi:unnamed protein product, partial [Iphiclides podalirius]
MCELGGPMGGRGRVAGEVDAGGATPTWRLVGHATRHGTPRSHNFTRGRSVAPARRRHFAHSPHKHIRYP